MSWTKAHVRPEGQAPPHEDGPPPHGGSDVVVVVELVVVVVVVGGGTSQRQLCSPGKLNATHTFGGGQGSPHIG